MIWIGRIEYNKKSLKSFQKSKTGQENVEFPLVNRLGLSCAS